MAIRVALHHKTTYTYERPVSIFPHVVRLRPAAHSRTPILSYALHVKPADAFVNWQQDPFANYQARIVFPEKSRQLEFRVDLAAELTSINPFDFFIEETAETFPFLYDPSTKAQLGPYLEVADSGPLLTELTEKWRRREKTIDLLVAINQDLQRGIAYLVRMEHGVQTPTVTLEKASGSCRDSAHLLVQVLRGLGLAARFVSGYLVQLVPDEVPVSGPRGTLKDFTDLHAWTEVFLPGAGWVGLDPTSGLLTAEGHIPLACTPDPRDAAPVSGSVEPCQSQFEFEMSVQRILETPRVTKPYTTAQWEEIQRMGQLVDATLLDRDVRLTIGGEPTFVSETDRDEPEWNIAADGGDKKEKAHRLARTLGMHFAPGAAFHSGQGKWYPGEPLPRWAYALFFRRDGRPVWKDQALLADDSKDYKFEKTTAKAFVDALAMKLVGHTQSIVSGVEDTLYYLWSEGNLPDDIDLTLADDKSPPERARLRAVLERGTSEPIGFALPLAFDWTRYTWKTSVWKFRRGPMYLIPGDSAMGYRLPLDRLIGKDPGSPDLSPLEPQGRGLEGTKSDLDVDERVSRRIAYFRHNPPSPEEKPPGDTERTALCVEVREGKLRVFLPPVWEPEQYLDLMTCIELTAKELGTPVLIEGYEPPAGELLERISVTPDPGVIEVNIHPSISWTAHESKLEVLYREARNLGLTAERFMHDGKRAGTGGGNHITLGSRHPWDSPFLRRPDLLGSFIVFVQHHPSLSYLFSGLYTGPTSQAPRVDEISPELLYELGLSLLCLPAQASPRDDMEAPWLVDRLLRNFLVDRTGNTHRTEICIDKLYSPDSLSGRLGLVEFRAFEMPYHHRMNAMQGLLMCALVAAFWEKPYKRMPIRWEGMLLDKFRLPGFLWLDFLEVLRFLDDSGFAIQPDWFLPFLESRFPIYGSTRVGESEIQLRMALEPWNVLGEEMLFGATARAVDSAVERLEVRITHFVPERHALLCNGRRIPLQSTGVTGEYVAGVRYKAWDPPRTMHPSLPVNSPLQFDLVELDTMKSLGGCTYHVFHPGGRSFDTSPVNEREAESRMLSRFSEGGHFEGKWTLKMENPEYPCTLDLRR